MKYPVINHSIIEDIGKKILILGCPGSGKTTLSLELARSTGLPCYHLDDLFWKKGWVPVEKSIFIEKIKEIVDKDQWILEGNYSEYLDIRLPKADTVIFLEESTITCLWRVLKRAISLKLFSDSESTLPKQIVQGFFDNKNGVTDDFFGFISFVLRFKRRERSKVLDKLEKYTNLKVITYSS